MMMKTWMHFNVVPRPHHISSCACSKAGSGEAGSRSGRLFVVLSHVAGSAAKPLTIPSTVRSMYTEEIEYGIGIHACNVAGGTCRAVHVEQGWFTALGGRAS